MNDERRPLQPPIGLPRSRRGTLLLLAAMLLPPWAIASARSEEEKITALISMVQSRKDLQFIRNGAAHGSRDAAEHLRSKRKAAGSRVKTARDFITHVASRSSVSGEPYHVQFDDGRRITTEQFLSEALARIERE